MAEFYRCRLITTNEIRSILSYWFLKEGALFYIGSNVLSENLELT